MRGRSSYSIVFLVCVVVCLQCTKDKGPDPTGDPECKFNEISSSAVTGFAIFDAGNQADGMAEGRKINLPWQASGSLVTDAVGNYSVVLRTLYDEDDPWSLVAEEITLGIIQETEIPLCYRLVREVRAADQIIAGYVAHPDLPYAIHYALDSTAINEFELTRFSLSDSIFEGKFSATFITDSPDAPECPELVRFINVHLEVRLMSDTSNEICVGPEAITSTAAGFDIFEPGMQSEGFAEGVKINMPWEASAFIFVPDPQYGHSLAIKTYWKDDFNAVILAELIYLANFPVTTTPICFDLTNDKTATGEIFSWYHVGHDDQPINRYQIDTLAVNKIEVKRFNLEERIFEGKLQATFITDDPRLPGLPERVRFFNVDIKIGVD